MRNPIVARTAAEIAAHQYAVQSQQRIEGDQLRRTLAIARLNALVSMCAELNRQLAQLEREVLAIAEVLVT